MTDSVVLALFDRVPEAHAARETLQASGISCTLDLLEKLNPHPTSKGGMGTLALTVRATDVEEAQRILAEGQPTPAEPAPPTLEEQHKDHVRRFERRFRRGVVAAVCGLILPGFGACASISEFRSAYQHDRHLFAGRRSSFAFAMLCNAFSFGVVVYIVVELVKSRA